MNFDAPHIGFVLASYGVTVMVLGVLIAAYVIRSRMLARRLEALEGKAEPRERAGNGNLAEQKA